MKNKGFTLIELLVVIAIIGLLSSIVLVNLKGQRDKARIAKGLQFSQSIHHALGAYAVGVWRFDEGSGITANDSSGYGNHGTLGDGTCVPGSGSCPSWTNDTPSGQDYALSFDGSSDYVDAGTNSVLNTGDKITYSAWVKLNSLSTETNVGQCIAGSYSPGYIFSLRGSSGGGAKLSLRPHGGSGSFPTATDNLELGKWYHVAGTHDGTNVRIYVNGIAKGSSTYTNATNQAKMIIGRASWSSSHCFLDGLIDEVRIYSQALEISQIESLYYVGLDNLLAKGLISEKEYQERL